MFLQTILVFVIDLRRRKKTESFVDKSVSLQIVKTDRSFKGVKV